VYNNVCVGHILQYSMSTSCSCWGTCVSRYLSPRNIWQRIQRFLLSKNTHFALRVSVSTAGLSSLVFVQTLRGFVVCYIAVFIFFAQAVISPHPYIGSVLRGSLSLLFAGLISGCCSLICIAAASGNAYALYFLFVVFSLLIALLRLQPELTPMGIFTNLMFAIQVLLAIKVPTSQSWNAVYPTWVSVCLASGTACIAALFIFPRSAKKELENTLQHILLKSSNILLILGKYIWSNESSDVPSEVIEECQNLQKTLYFCQSLITYLPFEPCIIPPWRAEPNDHWYFLADKVGDILVNLEAFSGVIRRGYGITPSSFHRFYGSNSTPFEKICEEIKCLATEVKNGYHSSSCNIDFHLREQIAKESLILLRRYWRNDRIFDRDSFPDAFEAISMLFFSLGLRSLQRCIENTHSSICELEKKRTELKFAPLRNWLGWIEKLLRPFGNYRRLFGMIIDKNNFKFLFKHTLAIALVAFPIIFVAEFSLAEYHFMEKYNALAAMIMVIIMFMRGIELTVFRIVLYCVSTVVSSALAYAATVFAGHNPYVLSVWLGGWTFIVSNFAVRFPPYLVVCLAFIFSEYFIVSCQYWLPKFTFLYSASRTLSVFAGCGITGFIALVLWPYRAADDVRNTLIQVASIEKQVFRKIVTTFLEVNRVPLKTAFQPSEDFSQSMNNIRLLLDRVRVALRADPSLSVTHDSLPKMLESLSSIYRRLVHLLAVLSSHPALTGAFSDSIWRAYLCHLEPEFINLLDAVDSGFDTVLHHFGIRRKERPPPARILLARENFLQCRKLLLLNYQHLRLKIIQNWREKMWNFAKNHSLDEWNDMISVVDNSRDADARVENGISEDFINGPPELKPDDNVRNLSFIYSLLLFFESFDSFLQQGLELKNAAGVYPLAHAQEMSLAPDLTENVSFARLSSLPSFRGSPSNSFQDEGDIRPLSSSVAMGSNDYNTIRKANVPPTTFLKDNYKI